jgi:hypothetical protein
MLNTFISLIVTFSIAHFDNWTNYQFWIGFCIYGIFLNTKRR